MPTSLIQSVFFYTVYDSDGEIGPISNLEEVEGGHFFDEEAVGQKSSDAQGIYPDAHNLPKQDPDVTESSASPHVHIPVEEGALVSMKKEEIEVELSLQRQKNYVRYYCHSQSLQSRLATWFTSKVSGQRGY